MKTKIYNKLVRDKIPELITANREKAAIKVLSDSDYFKALKQKLFEEVKEFNESEGAEEGRFVPLIIIIISSDDSRCACPVSGPI